MFERKGIKDITTTIGKPTRYSNINHNKKVTKIFCQLNCIVQKLNSVLAYMKVFVSKVNLTLVN